MRRAAALSLVVVSALLAPARAADAPGKAVYDKYCAQCHGENGDGKGVATDRVKPAPRDFTVGKYKFRTTPSGMLPTDADLRRVIRDGLPYTSMPGWPDLTDPQVDQLIAYLKTFSAEFQNADKIAPPIEIPAPPAITPESIEKGRLVYEAQGCAACHGDQGRGNGLSAPTLTDDWGHHVRAADLTQRWTFRGGPTRTDIFRTFSTGLNGTPMPSYAASLEVADRWDLVNYIVSLGEADTPGYAELVSARYVEDEIDLATGPTAFESAVPARFPLVGQIMEPGRDFYASGTSVQIQAVYNAREIAFLVRWNDMRAETTGESGPDLPVGTWDEELAASGAGAAAAEDEDDFWGAAAAEPEPADDFWGTGDTGGAAAGADSGFSDAVALQFPLTLPSGIRKPYFLFGDATNPVELWFQDLAANRPRYYTARGSAAIERGKSVDFESASGYDDGTWWVAFKRERRARNGISFEEGQFVPLAVTVWDGFNRERGNKRALSVWHTVYVEPAQRVSAVGPMLRVGLGLLALELLLIFFIRRRHAMGTATETRVSGTPSWRAQ